MSNTVESPQPRGRRGGLWLRFRGLPILIRVVAWLLLWPLLAPLLLVRSSRPSPSRCIAAATMLLVAVPVWAVVLSSVGPRQASDGVVAPTEPPPAESEPPPAESWKVTGVVDGDTIDVATPEGTIERVRIIGIDTSERGECGFIEASDALAVMVSDRAVELAAGAVDDRDRYGRILRYVDVDGRDAGLALIEAGLAIARYDSRDGYGHHPRQEAYVAMDQATPHVCSAPPSQPQPEPGPGSGQGTGPTGAWSTCAQARAAGAAPVYRGDPGYGKHLDGDDDGIGCE